MFLSDKPHYPEEEDAAAVNNNSENMMIELIPVSNNLAHHHQQQTHQFQTNQNQLMVLGESSGGEEHEPTKQHHHQPQHQQQKKRAETWVQDETRILISLRREMDGLFNTSKSNKHLWEQISAKMREKGFDRNPNMCTDKWRNLLKEFKKAKHHDNRGGSGGSGKMSCYKEIEEILRDRNKTATQYKNPTTTHHNNNKVDSFMHFSDKGIEDTSISFAHVEANGRPTLNLETGLDHDGHPLAIAAADAVGANGVGPWNWRETPENGGESQSYGGRVIEVTWGDYTRRIGIDGSADAIKEAIKAAFRLRTKRAFWLEDERQIVRSLDRDMPLGNYTLHLDEGLAVKVCLYDEADNIAVHTEDKVFYTEDDFREFLNHRAWTALREFDGYRNIENMDDLRPGAIYRGVS